MRPFNNPEKGLYLGRAHLAAQILPSRPLASSLDLGSHYFGWKQTAFAWEIFHLSRESSKSLSCCSPTSKIYVQDAPSIRVPWIYTIVNTVDGRNAFRTTVPKSWTDGSLVNTVDGQNPFPTTQETVEKNRICWLFPGNRPSTAAGRAKSQKAACPCQPPLPGLRRAREAERNHTWKILGYMITISVMREFNLNMGNQESRSRSSFVNTRIQLKYRRD